MVDESLGQIAGALALVAYIPLVLSILQGKASPNRATWWIWVLVGTLLGESYYASGARHTIWVPVSYVIGPAIVALLSIKRGEGGWQRVDRWCLYSTGISVIVRLAFFRAPLVALLTNLGIDFLGAVPTIGKSYHEPEKEDCLYWLITLGGNVVNMFAIEAPLFEIAVYPVYQLVTDLLIVGLLLRAR